MINRRCAAITTAQCCSWFRFCWLRSSVSTPSSLAGSIVGGITALWLSAPKMVTNEAKCPRLGLSIVNQNYVKNGDIPPNESSVQLMSPSPEFNDSESSVSSDESSVCKDDLKNRATWIGKMDFMLSCVGYAVGLGNIWRFPFLCYTSGGGAFLVPYFIFLILCGMPLFFLELSFGQFASRGPITIWNICPLFKGLGYGMVIISGVVCIYYNIIITWVVYYMFLSFNKILPWSTCDNYWNTDNCFSRHSTTSLNQTSDNFTSTFVQSNLSSFTNLSDSSNFSMTENLETVDNSTVLHSTASDEFWLYYVLQISKGIDDLGGIRWELFYCLIISWIVIFACLCRGVKSSGRVVYFSATFPYVVLIILFFRGVTLPGAWSGIKFYLSPKWSELLTFRVWGNAAVQIFYSLGPAWGGLLTMSSYNKFSNNVYRDAMVVPLINCGTSVFAGLVIFSIVGFMSHITNTPVEKVVSQGPGLAFVAYPEAVTKLPPSPLWAFLFFFMIFTVGLDSQFGMFETMISAFVDEFPQYLRKKKIFFTAGMCVLLFLLGIPIVTKGGIYIFMLMDWYCSVFALMFISFAECIVIAWIYGVDRFAADISLMIKRPIPVWWKLCWTIITPLMIVFIMIFTFMKFTPIAVNNYTYPPWAIGLGWTLAFLPIVPVPILMFIQIKNEEGPILQRVVKLLRPAANWGPATEENRLQYRKSVNLIPPRLTPNYNLDTHQPPSYSQVMLDDSTNV